jgi:hypothetical protein
LLFRTRPELDGLLGLQHFRLQFGLRVDELTVVIDREGAFDAGNCNLFDDVLPPGSETWEITQAGLFCCIMATLRCWTGW